MRRRWLAALLGAALIVTSAMAAAPPTGKPTPAFSLTLMDGRTVSLAELRGKPVLLNFWHSG